MHDELDILLRQSVRTLDSPIEAPRGLYERLRFVSDLLKEATDRTGGAVLLHRQADGKVACVPVTGSLTVGREAPRSLAPADARLSRRHFRITLASGRPVIEDLDSRNGTWVNGARIAARELLDGDVIEAGGQVFVFVGRM